MRTVITYGTFDLLHRGHVRLLERARDLGDRLIVGVTSDQFDRLRGKLSVSQTTLERVDAVRALGIADLVIIEEYEGQKIDDILRYGVDIFTVGTDWVGKFDYLREYCEVVYLDRTSGVSSTEIRSAERHLTMGLVGDVPYLSKFLRESEFVDGVEVTGICTRCPSLLPDDLAALSLVTTNYEELLGEVDSVFLISDPGLHVEHVRRALDSGVHVLCASPVSLDIEELEDLLKLAERRELALVESMRTANSTAYHRLVALVRSGAVGKVVSVDSVCTSLRSYGDKWYSTWQPWNSLTSWGPIAMLPILQLLGTDWNTKEVASSLICEEPMLDSFTRLSFTYDGAVASAKVGLGAKSEGELVVSGTKGYVYVPAPWWKTDYFELRYEDQTLNRRYFWQLDGEGIRDELVSFVKAVADGGSYQEAYISRSVTRAITTVMSDWYEHRDFIKLK